MSRSIALVDEAMRVALSQPVATAVTALIVAAVSGVIVSTTGQTIAIERDVLRRIDDAGTRTIVVEDTYGRGELGAEVVERVRALAGIDWAIGFGVARDVVARGLDGGAAVPIRPYFGSLPDRIVSSPWDHETNTALVGVDAIPLLGLATAAGPVERASTRTELGVVGWFDAEPPLEFLDRGLLTPPRPDDRVIRIIALASSAQRVPALRAALGAILDPVDPSSISIQTSDSLVLVRAAVQGELGAFGRNIITGTLAAGLVLTALNVLAAVSARRRDFGRRRALGASRVDIVTLVAVQTVVIAIVGAGTGAVIGTAVVQHLVGSTPPLEFTLAVATLAVVASTLAVVPPALIAAYRDPVRVLRVP